MHDAPDQQATTARAKTAILLFILCCLLSTTRLVLNAPRPDHIQRDEIATRSDLRFAALKAQFPASGVVGYIGATGDSALPDYYLTQYALAPVVVDHSVNQALVIGNFPGSSAPFTPRNLRLVHDFGNGVMLFAAKDPE